MDKFDLVYRFTALWEKGLSDHPKDPGGLTKNGVTFKWLVDLSNDPTTRPLLSLDHEGLATPDDLRALTDAQCGAIYKGTVWKYVQGDKLPLYAALCTFDMAVNSGPRAAIKTLQRAYNQALGGGLDDDGKLGPITISQIAALGTDDLFRLGNDYIDLRKVFYRSIGNDAMINGWINRMESTDEYKPGLRAYLKELKDHGVA